MNLKIRDCKKSDRNAKDERPYKEEEYITGADIIALRDELHNQCKYCYIPLQIDNMKAHDGLTIERLDNSKAHVKGNCTLACHRCNCMNVGVTSKLDKTRIRHAVYLKERRTQNIVAEILDEIILNVARLTVNSICGECVDG